MDDKEAKVLLDVTLKLKELAENNSVKAIGYAETVKLSLFVEAFEPLNQLVQAKEALDKMLEVLKAKKDKSISKDK